MVGQVAHILTVREGHGECQSVEGGAFPTFAGAEVVSGKDGTVVEFMGVTRDVTLLQAAKVHEKHACPAGRFRGETGPVLSPVVADLRAGSDPTRPPLQSPLDRV